MESFFNFFNTDTTYVIKQIIHTIQEQTLLHSVIHGTKAKFEAIDIFYTFTT